MARNNIGDSSHRHGSCLTLPPGWLSATCSAAGQITVTWSKPLGLNSESTVNYTGTISAPSAHPFGITTLTPPSGSGTAHTVAGRPGVTYNIAVRTQPIANKPTYSETATVECEAVAPPVPTGVEVECSASNRVVRPLLKRQIPPGSGRSRGGW